MPVQGPQKIDDNKAGAEGGSARASFDNGGGVALAIVGSVLLVAVVGVVAAQAGGGRKSRR